VKETTVVIPNYNGIEHLQLCLETLARQTHGDFDILMVDNGSKDGSVEFVRSNHPRVQIVQFDTNRGFAPAVNEGIRRAQSPYIILLNNDIELAPSWIEQMIGTLKKYPDAGAAASKMMNFFQRDLFDAAGDQLTWTGAVWARGEKEVDHGQYEQEEFIFGACAGAAAYRKEMFEEVGLFDESFFAYFEDVDLDLRMQLQGWKAVYVPTAVCYHKRGATRKQMLPLTVRLHIRNPILYLVKDMPGEIWRRRFHIFIASLVRKWMRYLSDGYFIPVAMGLWEAMLQMPEVLRERKRVQSKRKVSAEYIESLMGHRNVRQAYPANGNRNK
jgi:hypothetical protein